MQDRARIRELVRREIEQALDRLRLVELCADDECWQSVAEEFDHINDAASALGRAAARLETLRDSYL